MIHANRLRLLWLLMLSVLGITNVVIAQTWNPNHTIGTVTGVYNYNYNQTPAQLVEIYPVANPNNIFTYQWEQSNSPITGFSNISGATQTSYTIPGPLSQTTYYRRKSTYGIKTVYSNIIKISVVSTNWEDINYIREHDVMTTGITIWTSVDQLTIGQKLQTTTYLDGIGRATEKISRETATPANPNDTWGDMVQFAQYDAYGRQDKNYLSYTTTTQSGKFKTTPATEQAQYYTNLYNESPAYSTVSFDNSPLNRVVNVKKPGVSWAAASGSSAVYDLNTDADNVKAFTIAYTQGAAPVLGGYMDVYPARTLYKLITTDENGKQVIQFSDKNGQLILKKVQLDDSPANEYDGWVCTYYVYDDFGQLRCEIQPEGVKYLKNNSWSFTGTNGQTVLAEQCFQFFYDDKGRSIWKKTPGADPLNMLYDIRDRIVFMQDGNQAALSTPQWTASIYDELDRPIISTLYNTSGTRTQLQEDIDNSITSSPLSIDNPNQVVTDLVVNNRQVSISSYIARNSIEFVSDANGSFESAVNDEFVAEVNPNASQTYTVNLTAFNNPISQSNLNNASVTTILKYVFYDNYSFPGVKSFNNNYTNLSAYSASDPNVIPIAKTSRTTSMPTGSLTRVLGSSTFLPATVYYDERGMVIQSLNDNIKTGTDIVTAQYHFDGRLLSTCSDHTAPNTGYVNYKTLTKYIFDKLGRVTSTQKQFGTNAFKTISSFEYDDAGRVKTKRLDPGYTAGGNADLESFNYSYNIHSQLTGINKDYAMKNPSNYDKWGHFFGLYLGYDNRDNVFTNANLTGQITGVVWNTQGDDAQRRYNYTYDNAGRLVTAAYTEKQHTGDSWSNSQMDFSIKGTSGKITYDLNGNLLNMLQRGVIPGSTTPIDVDNLSYSYTSATTTYTNKLQTVSDGMTSTSVNGQFGDLKDGTNTTTPDYVYDNNGNLVIDLNKNVKDLTGTGTNGIKYNFLDKPEQIRIVGKGTIQIVYSANGEKLQRSFTPEGGGATITNTYIDQFIYQESSGGGSPTLQFINFEEGRIRVMTGHSQSDDRDALIIDGNMDLPNGKRGAYDFYIMDYLQNVRMILTEETHLAKNTCTMETDGTRDDLEEAIFGQTGANNEVELTRFSPVPSGWASNTTSAVSRLGTSAGHNIGPNTLQKVMAGDKVTANVKYYYTGTPGGNNTGFVSTMLSSLVQSIGGSAAGDLVKGNASSISTQLNGVSGFVDAVQPDGSNPGGDIPQAYLTILFFDERFNFIAAADGGVAQDQVSTSGDGATPLNIPDIWAPKNGYVYVYISNQSNNPVYFDDFQVTITTGNIIEENHYYAYGLKIATLSSKKLGNSYEGNLKNSYLYQGAFSEMDEDIGWNDFALRNYDPQVGRWVQQDPYQQFNTPYSGMGNDPVSNIDPTGGIVPPIGGLSTTAEKAITLGAVVVRSSSAVSATARIASLGTILTATATTSLKIAVTTANIINTNVDAPQVGARVEGEDPKIKIAEVRKAFQNGKKPAEFTLTVLAKQPIPGQRHIKAAPNPKNLVGHAWVKLSVIYEDGSIVDQSFGFYPGEKGGDAWNPQSNGSTFRNNGDHDWDEKLTKEITEKQFNDILDISDKYEISNYNLVSNNCTNFAVDAGKIGGIRISGMGSFPVFVKVPNPIPFLPPFKILLPVKGANPASLGQDMYEGKFWNSNPEHPIKPEMHPRMPPYRPYRP